MRRLKVTGGFILCILFLCACQSKEERDAGARLFYAIDSGDVQGVRETLESCEIDLEKLPVREDSNFRMGDRRALAFAIDKAYGNSKIVQMLIDAGADVNSKNDGEFTYLEGIMYGASERVYKEICEMLVRAGAGVSGKKAAIDLWFATSVMDEFGERTRGDVWGMAELMEEYGEGITPDTLKMYLEYGGCEFAGELIEHLEKSGQETGVGKDLEYAIFGENEKLLKYLAKGKVSDKKKVLWQAAARCNVEVLKALKEQGCDFGEKAENDISLLHAASKYNSREVVSYLMDEGLNPYEKTYYSQSNALTAAVMGANREVVDFLKKAGMGWQREKEHDDAGNSWLSVCRGGERESLEIMLGDGFCPTDQEVIYGYRECNECMFGALVERDIPYNKKYYESGIMFSGFTELCSSQPKFAMKICEKDKDLRVTPQNLQDAIESGSRELAVELIGRAESLDVCWTYSPLEAAVKAGDAELVKYLVEKGADINYMIPAEENDAYHTVMHTAACQSRKILEYLLEQGGDMTVRNYDGKTPYECAEEYKAVWNYEILEPYRGMILK